MIKRNLDQVVDHNFASRSSSMAKFLANVHVHLQIVVSVLSFTSSIFLISFTESGFSSDSRFS